MKKKRRLFSKAQVRRLYRLINEGKEDEIDWSYICAYYTLKTNFIREFRDYLDWDCISACHKHTKNFMREMKEEINWKELNSRYHNIDLTFLEENHHKHIFYILDVLTDKKLDKALEKYYNEMDKEHWDEISFGRAHKEWFLEKWKDYLNWDRISFAQNLSEQFIEKYIHKLNLMVVCEWQKLSDEFIKGHIKEFDRYGKYCWKNLKENRRVSKQIKETLVEDKCSYYFDLEGSKYWD